MTTKQKISGAWNWIKAKAKWIFIAVLSIGTVYAAGEIIIPNDPTATSTPPIIESVILPSIPVLPIDQVEDEWIEGKDQYNINGLLVSQVLEAEDPKLKKDKLSDIKKDLLPVQLEDTDLPEAEVLTLYVRGKGTGTASLWIGDNEIITLTLEKDKWLTKWDSVNVSAFGVSRFTQGQINNARVEFTGNIQVSNVRLYAEDQHSLTDNFDSYTDGDLDGQGSWAGSLLFDIQGTTVNSGTKAVYKTGDAANISKTFTGEADGSQIFYDMMPDATDTGHGLNIFTGSTIISGFREGQDKFFLLVCTAWKDVTATVGTPADNTWYKMEIEWRDSDDYIRARVDDGTWTTWEVAYNAFSTIDKIQLYSEGTTAGYLDDLGPVAAATFIPQPDLW